MLNIIYLKFKGDLNVNEQMYCFQLSFFDFRFEFKLFSFK